MVWGRELWDQERPILARVDGAIDMATKCRSFLTARCQLEAHYARDLRKLAKTYQAEAEAPDCGDEFSSVNTAWKTLLQETHDMAAQHDILAEGLQNKCAEQLKELCSDLKNKRKAAAADLAKHQKQFAGVRAKYEATRKAYDKASRELVATSGKLQGASNRSSKTKFEKLKGEQNRLESDAETAKNEHILAMHEFNEFQHKFYEEEQAVIFEALEQLERKRIQEMQQIFRDYIGIHKEVLPFLSVCVENIGEAVEAVDANQDVNLFVSSFKTGNTLPQDHELQDSAQPVAVTAPMTVQQINERRVKKSKLFKTTSRKKNAIREDFGHLPVEQRKKAISKKVAALEQELAIVNKTLDGLHKTIELYIAQPALGDQKSIDKARHEAAEAEKHKSKTAADLYRFQCYLAVLLGTDPPAAPDGYSGSRTSLAETDSRSMDSFASDQQSEDIPHSESFSDQGYHQDYATEEQPPAEDDVSEQVADASNAASVLAYAQALYDYPGDNEGESPLTAGEQVAVLEDDGSGWIRIINSSGVDGYAPKAYVQFQTEASA